MSQKHLSEQPWIDPTARVHLSELGAWTAVGARTTISESSLGDYSYVTNDSSIIYAQIGKFCSIAAHTRLNPGNHPMWRAALHHFSYRSVSYQLADDDDAEFFAWRRSHQVTLGHDVWIGHGAVILPGVEVGTGAVVGAGAVVHRDVPPFAIVSGSPAKLLRWRFEHDVSEKLLTVAWWHWTRHQLRAALPDFRRLSAEAFAEKYATSPPRPAPENDPTDSGPQPNL